MKTDLARLRLAAQHVTAPLSDPADVVRRLGAVQAQDYLAGLWAVGLRTSDAREGDVERAIADKQIVRTWPMRGTLHFVAAEDVRWMTELLAPKPLAAAASRLRGLALDAKTLARAGRVLADALAGGQRLTRPAAYQVLERARIATANSRGLHVFWKLAHDGLIVFGPREGKQPTFVLADEWLPKPRARTRDEALRELAMRYFASHGPATLADFAWWSGLKIADARAAIALAGKALESIDVGGRTYWLGHVTAPRSRRRAHLLPAFDEWLVAYTDRTAALDAAHAKRVNAGGGILNPTIVVDARVVGTWKRHLDRDELVFVPSPFAPLPDKEVAAELARYARFVGASSIATHISARRKNGKVVGGS